MGQSNRLKKHFALCTAVVAGAMATQANAVVVYSGVVNITVPFNIDGTYLNIETGAYGSTPATSPGWDVNPYGTSTTAVPLYAAVGTGYMRNPGAGTSTARTNLAADTPVDAASFFYGSSSATIGTLVGQWAANNTGIFGFKFLAADGLLHYGWVRMSIGPTASTRIIVDYAYDNQPAVGVSAGVGGGPPPPYDPCAAFNPVATIGNNSLQMNTATATDLNLGSCGVSYKANYFKFVTPATGAYSFGACAAAGARVAVLDGCAAGSAVLACDSAGSGCSTGLNLTSGQTVYCVVGGVTATPLPSPLTVVVGGPPLPACTDAVAVVFGNNAFDDSASTTPQAVYSNAAATTTATIQKTVWFTFTPGATGAYSFRLCGSTGDTMMAIGIACPSIGATFPTIAFNDDAPNCLSGTAGNLASIIDATNGGATGTFAGFPLTQDLVAGQQYYIVAGSYAATTSVSSTLAIDGPPQAPPCPGDYNSDGSRDGTDLATLLSAWGTPDGDIDGDGVTSGSDLATLLSGWGPCP